MSVKKFENNHWKNNNQRKVFRHVAILDLVKEKNVLDVGCGDGLMLEILKSKGIKCAGIDISDIAVEKCKNKGLDVRLVDFSDSTLPYQDESFDLIIFSDVLEHMYNPKNILFEAKRVARSILISVPNFNSLPARIQMFLGKVPENNKKNKGHIYWFNYENLKRMLNKNDLEIVDFKVNTFWENKFLIGRIMKILLRISPSIFALSFVIKAKNKND